MLFKNKIIRYLSADYSDWSPKLKQNMFFLVAVLLDEKICMLLLVEKLLSLAFIYSFFFFESRIKPHVCAVADAFSLSQTL